MVRKFRKILIKLLFGADMPEYHPTDNGSVLYENGNYKISVSNRGDGRYEFISAENVGDGMDVVFKNTDSTGTDFEMSRSALFRQITQTDI